MMIFLHYNKNYDEKDTDSFGINSSNGYKTSVSILSTISQNNHLMTNKIISWSATHKTIIDPVSPGLNNHTTMIQDINSCNVLMVNDYLQHVLKKTMQ